MTFTTVVRDGIRKGARALCCTSCSRTMYVNADQVSEFMARRALVLHAQVCGA